MHPRESCDCIDLGSLREVLPT
eukprot:COSAG01_NODE_56135_length_320_cov_0.941176_1_plen_21_part_10